MSQLSSVSLKNIGNDVIVPAPSNTPILNDNRIIYEYNGKYYKSRIEKQRAHLKDILESLSVNELSMPVLIDCLPHFLDKITTSVERNAFISKDGKIFFSQEDLDLYLKGKLSLNPMNFS